MDLPELFWPISRGLLREERNNTTEIFRLRSLITYQILFGGRLVIRDSDYANSLALRSSVIQTLNGAADEHATFFRTLLDERYLIISCREENSLGQVAEQLAKRGGLDLIPPEWYRSTAADIQYIESSQSVEDQAMRYSVKQAAEYYTQQILKMLSKPLEPYLDDEFRLRAAERVSIYLEQHGTLAWAFFRPDGAFWEGFSESDFQKHGYFFDYVLGQAPHAGFIPDVLGLSPIYMQDAAEAIDVWRGRHLQKKELIEERTIQLGMGFSFSDYIDYLCLLPFDALVALSHNDENAHFRQACELFSMQQTSFKNLERSYRDYRKAIDSELLRHHRTLSPSGGKTDLRAFLDRAKDESIDTGIEIVAGEFLGTVIPFWGLGLAFFYRLIRGEWPNERKLRLAREQNAVEIAGEIQRLQQEGEKVSEEIISSKLGVQDRVIKLDQQDVDVDICVAARAERAGA